MSGNLFQERLVNGGGKRAMQQLLKQTPDIDALFTASDQIAPGAIHQSGRPVSQGLAVVDFDNTPESVFSWLPLTTIYQKLVNVGHFALQNLYQMIKPELMVRASSKYFGISDDLFFVPNNIKLPI